jgi:hypothetical protein
MVDTFADQRNGIKTGQGRRLPIPHRPIAALPLVPHPQQRRVAGVDEVDDPHVGLAGVLAVQASGVLLQRALPGNGMASTNVSSGG